MKQFEYIRPRTIEEVIDVLAQYQGKAKLIAGGTDLVRFMRMKVVNPLCVVDHSGVQGLNNINYDERLGLEIGSLTTLRDLETSSVLQKRYPIISQAASKAGPVQVRNLGTLGGNLCQDTKCPYYALIHLRRQAPCHRGGGDICYAVEGAKKCVAMAVMETAAALICLDAEACIHGPSGERLTPLEKFFISSGVVDLRHDEILTAIKAPSYPPQTQGIYLKFSLRGSVDFAVVGVAVVLTMSDSICDDGRIGLLGVARTPIRARQAEALIKGEKIDQDLIEGAANKAAEEAHPLSDTNGSAKYKREIVRALTRKAIEDIIGKLS